MADRHSHEHAHTHSHEHKHGDVTHSHEHSHQHSHEHEHVMTEREALRRHLSKLGKKGGPKGGRARMASLTPKQRKALAKKAATARWKKENG
jgi:DNA-binding MarR family transcriptional regulator